MFLRISGSEKLLCSKCGKEIHPGEKIHRARVNAEVGSVIIFHIECWESMLIEC